MTKIIKLFLFSLIFFLNLIKASADEYNKLKIGLLIPLSGENSEIGESILKAVRMATKDIDSDKFEIIIKDTQTDPSITLKSSYQLKQQFKRN